MRVTCLVLGCRRTHASEGQGWEWVCGVHWPAVDRRLRARYARAKRRWRRSRSTEARARCLTIWSHCREQAIRRALGI